MRTWQTFLLIHLWTRDLLELPCFADESQSVGDRPDELVTRGLRLLVRLSRPFGALLLAQQRGGEYKRIASINNIIVRVRDIAAKNGAFSFHTFPHEQYPRILYDIGLDIVSYIVSHTNKLVLKSDVREMVFSLEGEM
ncbi:hypothetical protein DFJ58DRAFT_64551 [Suillus subalutaceus]|uniref:uncharacterized protein n=1 Tax=Suillus subalutaceus TaxID=48586 RepID=UPI001B865A87|nr:uncharacterized protein DFJ58DRAFT_64551 [Suillus subalutaceus]KAG1869439.1 hypothetical protein DFJ58DRAFT_64551 [Suillus subalutaceus]